jgi:hypothetical protein
MGIAALDDLQGPRAGLGNDPAIFGPW